MSMIDRLRQRVPAPGPIIRSVEPRAPQPRPRAVVPVERMAEAISTSTQEVLLEADNAMSGLLKVRDEAMSRNRVMIDAVDEHVRNNGQIAQALRKMGAEYINTMLHLMATAWEPERPSIAADAEAPKLNAVEQALAASQGAAEHNDP
jgi:hypothetical protein